MVQLSGTAGETAAEEETVGERLAAAVGVQISRRADPEAAKGALQKASEMVEKRVAGLEREEVAKRREAVAAGRQGPSGRAKAISLLKAARRKQTQAERMRMAGEGIASMQDRIEELHSMTAIGEALKTAAVAMDVAGAKLDVGKIEDMMADLLKKMTDSIEVSKALADGGSGGALRVGDVYDAKGEVVPDEEVERELERLMAASPEPEPLVGGGSRAEPEKREMEEPPEAPAPAAAPLDPMPEAPEFDPEAEAERVRRDMQRADQVALALGSPPVRKRAAYADLT